MRLIRELMLDHETAMLGRLVREFAALVTLHHSEQTVFKMPQHARAAAREPQHIRDHGESGPVTGRVVQAFGWIDLHKHQSERRTIIACIRCSKLKGE